CPAGGPEAGQAREPGGRPGSGRTDRPGEWPGAGRHAGRGTGTAAAALPRAAGALLPRGVDARRGGNPVGGADRHGQDGTGARQTSARPAADRAAPPTAEKSSPKAKPADRDNRTLTGRVLGPDGRPVREALVVLAAYAEEKTTTQELARTDANGQFRCVVPRQ